MQTSERRFSADWTEARTSPFTSVVNSSDETSPASAVAQDDDRHPDIVDALAGGLVVLCLALLWSVGY